jgi:oligopeptide/dipeptide ABC transporter ATP-binding protein
MCSIRDSADMPAEPLLRLRDLTVDFTTAEGTVRAVSSVSLEVERGECLAIVGESGSGKSQLFLGCLGLLASNGRAGGSARFEERELLGAPENDLNTVRGTRLGLVSQDPMNALTPHLRIGEQLVEAVLVHGLLDESAARARAVEVLAAVGMADAARRLHQYPHEFSGGMRQRVAIAMALMTEPSLLIADEPTTALDVTVQAQILDVLRAARRRGLTLVLITHDLGVVAGIADRVAVMYAGRIVELAPTRELFAAPAHPYTAALLRSVPRLRTSGTGRLDLIAGQPPRPGDLPRGCAFAPRCTQCIPRCETESPALKSLDGHRQAACHLCEVEGVTA